MDYMVLVRVFLRTNPMLVLEVFIGVVTDLVMVMQNHVEVPMIDFHLHMVVLVNPSRKIGCRR